MVNLSDPTIMGYPITPWLITMFACAIGTIVFAVLIIVGFARRSSRERKMLDKAIMNNASIPVSNKTTGSVAFTRPSGGGAQATPNTVGRNAGVNQQGENYQSTAQRNMQRPVASAPNMQFKPSESTLSDINGLPVNMNHGQDMATEVMDSRTEQPGYNNVSSASGNPHNHGMVNNNFSESTEPMHNAKPNPAFAMGVQQPENAVSNVKDLDVSQTQPM